jgi:ornithine cyclodeaminase/alanine dehydrogenase
MKIITHDMIKGLDLEPDLWFNWADTVLKNKHLYTMPAKTSLHFGSSYFNTMPSILPPENVMGVKVVDRFIGRIPSLDSQLMLYRYEDGTPLALMDASLITAMRTGAVTVHAMETFANPDFYEVGIMGFGNIGVATMEVLTSHFSAKPMKIKLLRYKDHAERIKERYSRFSNIEFVIVDTVKELIINSDVVISSITYTEELLGEVDWFKKGVLVIPVHLRGFQNCDTEFDKVYGDDYGQVKGFKYFNEYKYFAETSEVLRGEKAGREDHDERILSYNVGMSLHDIFAASKIYQYFGDIKDELSLAPHDKLWL